MTTTTAAAVFASLGAWAPAVVEAGVRGALLMGAVGVGILALRRASAAARHGLWAMGLVGLLALPLLTTVTPKLELVSLPDPGDVERAAPLLFDPAVDEGGGTGGSAGRASAASSSRVAGGGPSDVQAAPGPVVPPAHRSAAAAPPSFPDGALDPGSTLVFVWLAGAALLLMPVVAGRGMVARIGRRAAPVRDPRVLSAAARAADRIGFRRPVRLLEGPSRSMPMTWGVLTPSVMLPAAAAEWSADRLDSVLLHEIAHVARRDCLTQLLGEVARALHWFNPLVWWGERRLRVEREHACDDLTLAHGARPADYADQLLDLARSYQAPGTSALAALAMARPSQLEGRLLAVLEEGRRREPPGRRRTLVTALGVGVLASALAAAAPASGGATAAAEPDLSEAAGAWAEAGPAAGGPAPTGPARAVDGPLTDEAPARALSSDGPRSLPATCVDDGPGWEQRNHHRNNDRTSVTMRRPGCELDVRMEGEVEFDAAEPGVRSMRPGALLRIEEEDGDTERWLEVTPGPGGEPSFEYRLDGRAAAFDAEARAWFRDVMVALFRQVGFAVDERVEALLARGGVAAVLEEMEHLDSDWVQASYFEALLEQAELDEADFLTVLRLARERVDSDHYMAEILQRVVRHQPLTASLLDEYFEATLGIESDHYVTQVLEGAIRSGRLDGRQVAAALEVAGRMDSDHYRAQILENVAERYALEPSFRPAYLRATAEMDSDHYKAQVVGRLLQRRDLTSAELAEVVASSAMMESDHYRAGILQGVAARGFDDPAIHRAFFDAAAGLDSDHYYSQTMELLLSRDGLDPALLVDIVDHAARNVESDHYLSQMMLEVVERHGARGEVREALMRALDTLDSSHYRGRLSDALLRATRGG